jgi:hypothetical protein
LFEFKIVAALVVKTESNAVIEGFDVIEDGVTSLGEGGEALVVNQFILQTAKEGLDEGVVVAVGLRAMEAVRPC